MSNFKQQVHHVEGKLADKAFNALSHHRAHEGITTHHKPTMVDKVADKVLLKLAENKAGTVPVESQEDSMVKKLAKGVATTVAAKKLKNKASSKRSMSPQSRQQHTIKKIAKHAARAYLVKKTKNAVHHSRNRSRSSSASSDEGRSHKLVKGIFASAVANKVKNAMTHDESPMAQMPKESLSKKMIKHAVKAQLAHKGMDKVMRRDRSVSSSSSSSSSEAEGKGRKLAKAGAATFVTKKAKDMLRRRDRSVSSSSSSSSEERTTKKNHTLAKSFVGLATGVAMSVLQHELKDRASQRYHARRTENVTDVHYSYPQTRVPQRSVSISSYSSSRSSSLSSSDAGVATTTQQVYTTQALPVATTTTTTAIAPRDYHLVEVAVLTKSSMLGGYRNEGRFAIIKIDNDLSYAHKASLKSQMTRTPHYKVNKVVTGDTKEALKAQFGIPPTHKVKLDWIRWVSPEEYEVGHAYGHEGVMNRGHAMQPASNVNRPGF